jgi:hypothetical protein
MNTLLAAPDLYHYNIATHNGFHKRCIEIFRKYDSIIDALDLIDTYAEKGKQEDYIYKWMRRKKHTEKKAEIDHLRDKTYKGAMALVRVNLRHFDPVVHEAANHIYKLLNNYGDVVHANYDAETTSIDSILTHLQSEAYIEDVKLLSLLPWLARLHDLNTQFKQYVQETAQEEINKPNITPIKSRRQTDEALKKITERIQALASLNGQDKYMPLAREINGLVNHYNQLVREHYGRIHARISIDSAYIAPILPQTFTGRPIFAIPELKLKLADTTSDGIEQVVELIYIEDFTASYKNNVNPGTATIRIQGVGKYKGEIVTTFNIE